MQRAPLPACLAALLLAVWVAPAAASPCASISPIVERCRALCSRVTACKVPSFWGMESCVEYCSSGKYEDTFVCLDHASQPCDREHIETCMDPCD